MEVENFTVANLEELLHRYNTQTDNEIRAQIEEVINEWRNSNQAFPQSLEIIQSSQNENFILFAIITLEFILRTKLGLFTEEHVNILMTTTVGRLGTPLSERLSDNIFHLIAYTINSFPSTFEQFISQSHFDRTQLIPLLDYVYQISIDLFNRSESSDESIRYSLTEEQSEFHGKLNQMGEIFAAELLQTDPSTITPHWISFLKRLFGLIPDVSYFNQFLPYIQVACQNPNLIPSLLDFYSGENSVLCYAQTLNYQPEYDFFKAFIELYIAFAEQMIGTQDETMLNYSTFIWYETIDLTFDFYGSEFVGIEFSEAVFTKFLEFMTIIHQNFDGILDENTFLQLLKTYADCIGYQSSEVTIEYKAPFILQAIEFFVAYIDQSPNIAETCSDELDPITEALMQNCLYGQEGSDDEELKQIRVYEDEEVKQKKTDYEQLLSIYLDNKYKSNELTNGVIYVFSFSPDNIRKLWANGILAQIFSMEEPPITSIYWIEKCMKYTPESIDRQITLFYNLIPSSPLTEVSKVFFALTSKYPEKFLQNSDTLFAPLFELTAQIPMDSTSALLMSSIFNALWSLAEQARNLGEAGGAFLEENKEYFEQASALFASKIGDSVPDLNYLKNLTDFLLQIIENSNNKNGSMSFFYSTLYQGLIGLYEPFFASDDEQIQKDMCNLMSSCLNFGWVADKQPVFDWITQLIQVPTFTDPLIPVSAFNVLSGLPEFLPSEPVNNYILHGIESQDTFLIAAIVYYFDSVLKDDPNLFFTRIPGNLSFIMLQNQSSIAIEKYFQFFDDLIVNAPMDPEAVLQLCQMIAARGFNQGSDNSIIQLTLDILKHASQKYGITEAVVQLIVQALSIPAEQAAQFAVGFAQDDPSIYQEVCKQVFRILES